MGCYKNICHALQSRSEQLTWVHSPAAQQSQFSDIWAVVKERIAFICREPSKEYGGGSCSKDPNFLVAFSEGF